MTVTEAARNFADLINRAYYRGETTLLTRSGEVVARLVPATKPTLLGSDLAELWDKMPHLSTSDADAFEQELSESRSKLKLPSSQWD